MLKKTAAGELGVFRKKDISRKMVHDNILKDLEKDAELGRLEQEVLVEAAILCKPEGYNCARPDILLQKNISSKKMYFS